MSNVYFWVGAVSVWIWITVLVLWVVLGFLEGLSRAAFTYHVWHRWVENRKASPRRLIVILLGIMLRCTFHVERAWLVTDITNVSGTERITYTGLFKWKFEKLEPDLE